ncbi:LLM class flavin-dependent oxidoreductase [Bacillus lacus]|uniref:LLM class flavin-dependent oxidoreductase n=1 Tax=Metabacillus lacus TaxID=1983721 RepID=A0A7X2J0G7_9BACI|nr:alkanesulfonate monooxygenase [Metabacillus lacus]MRX73075.1 LLM class flavin-dependent oxidoreductase [Metabacillus lacus]
MKVYWFLPTAGDGRYLGTSEGERSSSIGYLKQVAIACDENGFEGILVPTGRRCEDAWVLASNLAGETEKLKFLVAMRPGLMSPALSARMAATLDRISNGRVLLNVVQGGNPIELAGEGLHLTRDDRYKMADEFLTVWRNMFTEKSVNFQGDFLHIEGGGLDHFPVQKPYPPLFLGGASRAAQEVAARNVDVFLTWGEPVDIVEKRIAEVKQLAKKEGRELQYGLRIHVIVRETEREAWEAAESLIKYVDEDIIEETRKKFSVFDSKAQTEMTSLSMNHANSLQIRKGLWAGIGLVREGAGTALVGDPDQVLSYMKEYQKAGISHFILSGYPHLEEAYRVGELLLPRLKDS